MQQSKILMRADSAKAGSATAFIRKGIGARLAQEMAMRILAVFISLTIMALPVLAARRVSIKQFEQGFTGTRSKSDAEQARWIFDFELTERVSAAMLTRWSETAAGDQSRRALIALVDSAAFQNLPQEEVPKTSALDGNGQQKVIALATAYIDSTLSKLPNFFATETVSTFADSPSFRDGASFTSYEPMHYKKSWNVTVLYRSGKEVMETKRGREVLDQDQTASAAVGLLSTGEFGPVLHTVLSDAQGGKLTWSHWETLGTSTIAVFHFAVPEGKSHYKVKVLIPGHGTPFQVQPAYHGEIGIDPATGTILRLTLRADMSADDPLAQADLMVEYGPVEIGAKTYICPVKSVARVMAPQLISPIGRVMERGNELGNSSKEDVYLQTVVNDIAFGHYQVLRSEAKILTGADLEDNPEKP
jgi:hypothetical protein